MRLYKAHTLPDLYEDSETWDSSNDAGLAPLTEADIDNLAAFYASLK